MPFTLRFSLSAVLSLGGQSTSSAASLQQNTKKEDHNTPCAEPVHALSIELDIESEPPATPVRPRLPRFQRYLQSEGTSSTSASWNFVDDPIAESSAAKAKDRESLDILLRSTSDLGQPVRDESQQKLPLSPDEHDDFSSVQPSPITFPNTLPSRMSPWSASDASSDLVSSLQRLRVGGLASYFESLDRSARLHSSTSNVAGVRETQREDDNVEQKVERMEQWEGDDEDWEEMTAADASD